MMIILLKVAATVQIIMAILNLNLVAILNWRPHVASMPLLVRQVFHVHAWFISLTLFIFALMTWRFADEMAERRTDMAIWLAGNIAFFWLVRLIIQVAYYSPSHWRGNSAATCVHVLLLVVFSGFILVYATCVLGVLS